MLKRIVQSFIPLLLPVLLLAGLAAVSWAAPGDLDPTFDGDGIVTTPIGSRHDSGTAVAVQSDGKIVVAGESSNGSDYDFALARYNSDGSLDTTFDADGIVTTPIGSGNDHGAAVAVQSDGKIVVAGGSYTGSYTDFALARYHSNGSLDTTFDADGIVTTPIGSGDDYGTAVAVQSDGKIVVAGYSYNSSDSDFALARYHSDGSLDPTFDADGRVTTPIGSDYDYGAAVAVQSDGKIVVAGSSYTGSYTDFALARYETTLSLPEMTVLGGSPLTAIVDGDTSPSLTDHTDFGSVTVGQALTRTFIISNSGDLDLSISSLSLSGPAAGDFSITGIITPTTVISAATATFQVRFTPSLTGTRAATVTIANNDGDENPYDFAIQGTGDNTAPIANASSDQNVTAGAVVTLNGSASSDPDGHTPLTYGWTQTGGPAVSLSSASVVTPTFTAPSSKAGLTFTLTVTDSFGLADPTPDLVVVTVTAPEIAVLGNGVEIADSDSTPSPADHTNFGSVTLGQALTRTFIISNSDELDLSISRLSLSGPAAGDFGITGIITPTTIISANTTTFQVRFTPSLTGTRAATVTIVNNDPDENPYDFAIQGTGTAATDGNIYLPIIIKSMSLR